MKLIRCLLLLFSLATGHAVLQGQKPVQIAGQILVSLAPGTTPKPIIQRFVQNNPGTAIRRAYRIADMMNIWLFETSANERGESSMLEWLQQQPEVRIAQFNHRLEERGNPPDLLPNDPLFGQQWQHLNNGSGGGVPNADFDSDLAWNITTGGITPLGDTIAVAVVDGGIDYAHEDLAANMWRNYADIPGDSIDNDGNGYTDDFRGWNVYTQTDNINGLATGHGTPVSAIVGAKGNNAIGVAGVNWDVKLLFVAGNDQESAILSAYDYVLKARRRYNASNGQAGAFVVAVNCSWGVTFGQPSDAPIWCAAFDTLGAAGILSVAATANMALDIDAVGDLPTACPSDYLISVTSLNKSDQKASNAAWGAQTIDLGAYGKDVFTAGNNNIYSSFTGTSFAAPQVSGAIGLLYSAPCPNLAAIAKANPALAALRAKELILNNTTPNSDLQNKTVTGGRLNLNQLIQGYQNQCVDCLPPLAISTTEVKTQEVSLRWSQVSDVQSVNLRWRKVGDPIWTLVSMVQSPFKLGNLTPCTDYEITLRGNCGGTSLSAWSAPFIFRTDGCCAPPTAIAVSNIDLSSATIQWTNLTAATGYRIRLKPDNGTWEEYTSDTNTLIINTLTPCTQYAVQVQTLCGNEDAPFSDPFLFRTTGCGACLDKNYCVAKSKSAKEEWISNVTIGSWSNHSGGVNGYENFTGSALDSVPALQPNTTMPVSLSPGFSGLEYLERFRIYIDYNGDGIFEEPAERAFDPGFASNAAVNGEIMLPVSFGATGLSRMRVLMKYKDILDAPPTPCETFDFGQVEDYCVLLKESIPAPEIATGIEKLRIYPQPITDWLSIEYPASIAGPGRVTVLNITGQILFSEQQEAFLAPPLQLDASGWPAGTYLIRLENDKRLLQQQVLKIR